PLDEYHNRQKFLTQLNSEHYQEGECFHILRPRRFDDRARERLAGWVRILKRNAPSIRESGLLLFNENYLLPSYAVAKVSPEESVCNFARIVCGKPTGYRAYNMFCSEFVWHLLSLALSSDPQTDCLNLANVQLVF